MKLMKLLEGIMNEMPEGVNFDKAAKLYEELDQELRTLHRDVGPAIFSGVSEKYIEYIEEAQGYLIDSKNIFMKIIKDMKQNG